MVDHIESMFLIELKGFRVRFAVQVLQSQSSYCNTVRYWNIASTQAAVEPHRARGLVLAGQSHRCTPSSLGGDGGVRAGRRDGAATRRFYSTLGSRGQRVGQGGARVDLERSHDVSFRIFNQK